MMKILSTRKLADTLEQEGLKVLAASERIQDLADSERILKKVPKNAVNDLLRRSGVEPETPVLLMTAPIGEDTQGIGDHSGWPWTTPPADLDSREPL